MEFLSPAWLSALAAIILIDLVLAGDNAIVIALAARRLPPQLQRRAIVWGTVGAIVVRAAMTVGVVWLLKIPGLMLVGGLGLVWIAYKLIVPGKPDEHAQEGAATGSFWAAMRTIVVADALMGVDNVLGVAGAAQGSIDLVVIGLAISVPIVVFGSTLVLRLVERFPAIIYIGAAVLAYTAGHMIVSEPLLDPLYDPNWVARMATYAVIVTGVLAAGWWAAQRARDATESHLAK
jgi:YjbE family integral membrane protein